MGLALAPHRPLRVLVMSRDAYEHGSQYELFGGTPPHEDAETSREAAEAIRPHVSRYQRYCLNVIGMSRTGLTCDGVEQFGGLPHQTVSARMRELALKKLIKKVVVDGKPLKRATRSGRLAFVWERA